MSIYSVLTTTWAVTALILLIVSWRGAARGEIKKHKLLMIFLTAGAWIFVINYISQRQYQVSETPFPKEYIPWIAFHGTVGLIPLLGATLLIINRIRKGVESGASFLGRNHARYGRVLIVLWCFTHLGGIFNALFLR